MTAKNASMEVRARVCFVCGGEGGFRWMEGHPDGECGENGTRCPLCDGSGTLPSDFQPFLLALLTAVASEAVAGERPFTLRQLQDEQRPWVAHNFAGRHPYYPLLGAMEELGELSHAHLKALQGIRGTPEEHHAAKVDAVADIIIFLSDYCTAEGIDLQDAVERTWAEVRKRDWKADPMHGKGGAS